MLDGLFCLRHHTIISRHHQNHDVGRFGTPRSHCSKGGVTGGIEEGDHAPASFHVVRPNVLGNSSRFATGDSRLANIIQQRRFTMVDVAHDGHYRRSWLWITALVGQGFLESLLDFLRAFEDDAMAELFHHKRGGVLV